jgi:hypothetical protein
MEIMIQQVVDWIKTKPSEQVIRDYNDLWHKTQVDSLSWKRDGGRNLFC